MSLLSGFARDGEGPEYDDYDEFAPEHLPEPGPFLDGAVLTGREHAAFHRATRTLFERRGVIDMTFGYNLARLNLDRRHPDSGFRYARETETDGERVLRAEFAPTTEFCPQSDTLTVGAFRAWNGCRESHEYDLVRVRVDPMHHQSATINAKLRELETVFREAGEIPSDIDAGDATAADDVVDEGGFDTPF
ncbi:hypothetical protein [Halomicrobium katesii]|uniref:hypothetical protein n=1 Tax=Halomicrobium katesii TaxID=437163 RepID=UPI00037C2DF4|nr:hypothetical protein [Halomicrobium katesii]